MALTKKAIAAAALAKLKDLQDVEANDVLGLMGLETKREKTDLIVPALGMFGVGLLVGAGLGLLFAPKKGTELRNQLTTKLKSEPKAEKYEEMSV